MSIDGIIYCYINKINDKCYIGQTTKNRWSSRHASHRYNGRNSKNSSMAISSALNKYGYDNFELIKLCEGVETTEELNILETSYILWFASNNRKFGYNLNMGGDATRIKERIKKEKYRFPDDRKKRLSDKRVGSKNPFFNKKHSDETLTILSEKSSGRNNASARAVWCVELNKFFFTIREANEYCGMTANNIGSAISGIQKTSGGYHWRYATEQEKIEQEYLGWIKGV